MPSLVMYRHPLASDEYGRTPLAAYTDRGYYGITRDSTLYTALEMSGAFLAPPTQADHAATGMSPATEEQLLKRWESVRDGAGCASPVGGEVKHADPEPNETKCEEPVVAKEKYPDVGADEMKRADSTADDMKCADPIADGAKRTDSSGTIFKLNALAPPFVPGEQQPAKQAKMSKNARKKLLRRAAAGAPESKADKNDQPEVLSEFPTITEAIERTKAKTRALNINRSTMEIGQRVPTRGRPDPHDHSQLLYAPNGQASKVHLKSTLKRRGQDRAPEEDSYQYSLIECVKANK